jgi:hypothetical protein
VTGQAAFVSAPGRRDALARQFVAERAALGVVPPSMDDALFEFDIESCLLTMTADSADLDARDPRWRRSTTA